MNARQEVTDAIGAGVEARAMRVVTEGSTELQLTAEQLVAQKLLVQKAMRAVMKRDVHYGVIPGTQKPTLYKAGSEALLSLFRLSAEPHVEDLSRPGVVHYRVKVMLVHQVTGLVVGFGTGECSSAETKYAWRKANSREEFEAADPTDRRVEHKRGRGGSTYTVDQVRTNPADVANTVLKMAKKRAQIDATLTATAASDVFDQDLEDLEGVADIAERQAAPAEPAQSRQSRGGGQRQAPADGDDDKEALTDKAAAELRKRIAAIKSHDDANAVLDDLRAYEQGDMRRTLQNEVLAAMKNLHGQAE